MTKEMAPSLAPVTTRTKVQASRLRRPAHPRPIQLTPRDVRVLADLATLRVVRGSATFVLAASHSPAPLAPVTGWKDRETQLWAHVFLARFYEPRSFYKRGSAWPRIMLEVLVSTAIDRGLDIEALTPELRTRLRRETASRRGALVSLLVAAGIDAATASAVLERNSTLAAKCTTGRTSTIPHFEAAATFATLLWYGCRARGLDVANQRGDGFLKLAYPYPPDDARHGTWGTIEPDLFFTIPDARGGLQGFAIEAETGSHGGGEHLEAKIRAYECLSRRGMKNIAAQLHLPFLRSFRVLFLAPNHAYADLLLAKVATVFKRPTGLVLVTTTDTFHLAYPQRAFRTNPTTEGTFDLPLYTYLASLVTRAVFQQVATLGERGSTTSFTALLPPTPQAHPDAERDDPSDTAPPSEATTREIPIDWTGVPPAFGVVRERAENALQHPVPDLAAMRAGIRAEPPLDPDAPLLDTIQPDFDAIEEP